MAEWVAGKGTTALGIIGTSLGGLAAAGGLGGILGGIGGNQQTVSREAFDLSMQLNKSERDNALLAAELNTEKKMVEVFNALNDKINKVVSEQTSINAAQAVTNCGFNSAIAVAQNNIAQLMSLTALRIPNTSVCPGWGNVTVAPTTASATT